MELESGACGDLHCYECDRMVRDVDTQFLGNAKQITLSNGITIDTLLLSNFGENKGEI